MINYRPLHTWFIGCLAVVFWCVNVSSIAAFFDDKEHSPENHWQGAVVNLTLDALVPLTTPDSFTIGKHSQSLDLYYQLVVVGESIDTCEGVSIELVGPAGTTTATVDAFPMVAATELGQWNLGATHSAAASELECQFTLQVKAWAKETPEMGFSDTKDILVVVPGRTVSLFTAEPITTGGTEELTAASQNAPVTDQSGSPSINEPEGDTPEKGAVAPEEAAPEEKLEGEESDDGAEAGAEGNQTEESGKTKEKSDEKPAEPGDEPTDGEDRQTEEEPASGEADNSDTDLTDGTVPVTKPEDDSSEPEPVEEEPDTPPSDVDSESEQPKTDTPDAKPEDEPEVSETESDV